IRTLCGANLERFARGGDQGAARRGEPRAARGQTAMSAIAALGRERLSPRRLGVGAVVSLLILAAILVRKDLIDQLVGMTRLVCRFDNNNYLTLATALAGTAALAAFLVSLARLFSSTKPPRSAAYGLGAGSLIGFF